MAGDLKQNDKQYIDRNILHCLKTITTILRKQEVKEYIGPKESVNAYLLTVELPKHPDTALPYRVFKVELEDLENGDRGEGLYYMEKENYMK